MNILVLTPYYPIKDRKHLRPDTNAVHYFTREWVKLGHNVLVIHTYFHSIRNILNVINNGKSEVLKNMPSSFRVESIEGVKVALLENQWFIPKSTYMFGWQDKRQNDFALKILNSNDFQPDVIVTHFPTYYKKLMDFLSENINCPKVAVFHRTDIEVLEKRKKSQNQILNQYDGFGFRSAIIHKRFRSIANTNKNEFLVLSGAPDKFLIDKPLKSETFNSKVIKILYVGKLVKNKNVDKVINSLANLKNDLNFVFTIIGDGPERDNLKSQILNLGLKTQVKMISSTSRENVLLEMGKSDIFIMISRNETFGLVYLEAMASGCIVIGSSNEGIDGVIKNNVNGYLIDNGDEGELTSLLVEIANMNNTRLEMVKAAAHSTALEYTESKVALTYLDNIIAVMSQ